MTSGCRRCMHPCPPCAPCLQHDDAVTAVTSQGIRGVIDQHKNRNGCNVPATFFVLEAGTSCELARSFWEVRGRGPLRCWAALNLLPSRAQQAPVSPVGAVVPAGGPDPDPRWSVPSPLLLLQENSELAIHSKTHAALNDPWTGPGSELEGRRGACTRRRSRCLSSCKASCPRAMLPAGCRVCCLRSRLCVCPDVPPFLTPPHRATHPHDRQRSKARCSAPAYSSTRPVASRLRCVPPGWTRATGAAVRAAGGHLSMERKPVLRCAVLHCFLLPAFPRTRQGSETRSPPPPPPPPPPPHTHTDTPPPPPCPPASPPPPPPVCAGPGWLPRAAAAPQPARARSAGGGGHAVRQQHPGAEG